MFAENSFLMHNGLVDYTVLLFLEFIMRVWMWCRYIMGILL